MTAALYPQHQKLESVQPLSQACGEFIEWLEGKGIHLAERWRGEGYQELLQTRRALPDLLSEFFGIDLVALEAEKRQMLAAIRSQA